MFFFLNLEGVESLRRRGEFDGLHVDELVGDHCFDYVLMIGVVGKVHEDGVGVGVGILGRMTPREVLVLD